MASNWLRIVHNKCDDCSPSLTWMSFRFKSKLIASRRGWSAIEKSSESWGNAIRTKSQDSPLVKFLKKRKSENLIKFFVELSLLSSVGRANQIWRREIKSFGHSSSRGVWKCRFQSCSQFVISKVRSGKLREIEGNFPCRREKRERESEEGKRKTELE